jgi:hypothetical protein
MKTLSQAALLCLLIILNACESDPCENVVCQNGGTCVDGTCDCPTGFEGKFCEVAVKGRMTFWIDATAKNVGTIEVFVDNRFIGTIDKYFNASPDCRTTDGVVYYEDDPGTYTFYAESQTGVTWTITKGSCKTNLLNCNNGCTPNGNPDNNTPNPTSPTVTTPTTNFIASQDYTVNNQSAWWTQEFTIGSAKRVVFRFTSQYQAQAAIISPSQLTNFKNQSAFTAIALFDKKIGYTSVELQPDTYHVGVRNAANGANKWSVEIDYDISLPATDKCTFVDNYLQAAESISKEGG